MGQIALEGMEFFAYHGFFDEEQKIGNKYNVDLFIDTDLFPAGVSDSLSDTIDYSKVYDLVAAEMKISGKLLEHVAYRIIDALKSEFRNIQSVKVQVSKFNPPVGGIVRCSKITLEA